VCCGVLRCAALLCETLRTRGAAPAKTPPAGQDDTQAGQHWQAGSGTIWATTNGTYVSTDNGLTWARLSDGVCHPAMWLAVNPEDPSLMVSGNERGVCISADGGITWQESNTGLAALIPAQTAVSHLEPDTLYVRSPGLDLAKSESGG
jgi:photosystem II stability/assembly factor-like uncharacterized protein